MPRIYAELLIDWPHGPYGYVPWTHKARQCAYSCSIADSLGRVIAFELRVDLERSWKRARQKARKKHISQFKMFVAELVDDIVHEFHHIYEAPYTIGKLGEKGAVRFAAAARVLLK